MALERFIAEHLRIAVNLVGVPCERMTALEIHLAGERYEIAKATLGVDRAECLDGYNGTYTGLQALLEAIGDKLGVDYNDNYNACESLDYMDDDDIMEMANELLAA